MTVTSNESNLDKLERFFKQNQYPVVQVIAYELLVSLDLGKYTKDFHSALDKLTGFLREPASTKYHLSVEGGLVYHSISVAWAALKLRKIFFPLLDEGKVIIAAIFHDLGKLGIMNEHEGLYIPRYGSYNALKEEYEYNKELDKHNAFFPLHELDAINALRVFPGIPADVLQAIRVADGFYIEENKPFQHKISQLTHLIHMADSTVGLFLETKKTSLVAGLM